MALDLQNTPAFYPEAPVERAGADHLGEQDIAGRDEPTSPRRASREREGGSSSASEPQLQRNGSLRSNPPTSWRPDGRTVRQDDYATAERRLHAKPAIVADRPRSQKRPKSGTRPPYAEPVLSETAENDFANCPRAQISDRASGQYSRYADDYSEAERGYGTRTSQESRKIDEHPLSEDSEKPFNSGAQPHSSRPGPFGRTFTQKFSVADPGPTMDFKSMSRADRKEVIKLPWYQLMESNLKNHVVAALGELVGTTMFLFFAFAGTAVASIPAGTGGSNPSPASSGFSIEVQMYISLAFGFSLMVNVWVFYRVSGGLFNPAVTLALLLVRVIPPSRAAFVFVAQLAGGIAAAGMASAMFPTTLDVRTKLTPGVSLAQGFFIELVLTFELVFTIFMLAAEKHKARYYNLLRQLVSLHR
ncbi:MAG: hypothetical protein Q9227_002504 [Pyrenula ochraceoflavens]